MRSAHMGPGLTLPPDLAPVAGKLIGTEGPALVEVADRVGAALRLCGQGLLAKVLRLAGRAVAKGIGAAIVPPGALVERGPVENFIFELGMFKPDADQLHKVLRGEPNRQPALIERLLAQVADPEAEHPQAILVGVKGAQCLTERLAETIAGVGPHGDVGADALHARVEADGVVGGGKHDAASALATRRLEQIAAADDVGVEDPLPGALDRMAAQVNDTLAAVHRPLDFGQIAKFGGNELLP